MPGVVDLLAELADPACYPDRPRAVEIVQTHISVVCVTDTRAYKLKKELLLPFLDASTYERRLFWCHEELRLNRRLCPDVYLDVAVLVRTEHGLRFVAERPGALEPAVVMKRLPAERMLDRLLEKGAVGAAMIEDIARRVAGFHAKAARGPEVTAAGSPRGLHELALANFSELARSEGHGLSRALLDALQARTRADFAWLVPVLERRAREGRVVEGHGDLHARNICMTEPPAIYDCIEFEPAFRCGDVATEVAFLVMDLRYRGAPVLARAFADAYAAASGDGELPGLLGPLVCYRAVVRAKVAEITSGQRELAESDRAGAKGSAARHLRLAAVAALEQRQRTWWITCGPPASGKTQLCSALHAASGWPHVATDVVRKELAGIAPNARAAPEHYTERFSDATYAEVLRRAAASAAPVVLVDGNFATRERRAEARAAAAACGAAVLIVQVETDAATALDRLAQRSRDPRATSDAGPETFAALRARFVPPAPDEGRTIVVDGAAAIDKLLDATLARALG